MENIQNNLNNDETIQNNSLVEISNDDIIFINNSLNLIIAEGTENEQIVLQPYHMLFLDMMLSLTSLLPNNEELQNIAITTIQRLPNYMIPSSAFNSPTLAPEVSSMIRLSNARVSFAHRILDILLDYKHYYFDIINPNALHQGICQLLVNYYLAEIRYYLFSPDFNIKHSVRMFITLSRYLDSTINNREINLININNELVSDEEINEVIEVLKKYGTLM